MCLAQLEKDKADFILLLHKTSFGEQLQKTH